MPPHRGRWSDFGDRMRRLTLYVLLAGAAALCVQFSLLGPEAKLLGLAVALMVAWIGFCRLRPAGVRLVLVSCMLLSLQHFPPMSVALLVAAMVGGEVGAHLTRRDAEEDNFFFLPLLSMAATLALLITLGVGGGWGETLRRADLGLAPYHRQVEQFREMLPREQGPEWFMRLLQEAPTLYLVTVLAVMAALGLWLAGRLARRQVGRLRGLRSSPIVFQIHQRYIFLLILGLILEILCSLAMRDTLAPLVPWRGVLRYFAWPVLAVVALAAFLEGLGIVLFLATMRRMAGQVQSAFWLTVIGVPMAVLFWQFTVVIGLADVWLDFRKLERLRRQLEAATPEQKD